MLTIQERATRFPCTGAEMVASLSSRTLLVSLPLTTQSTRTAANEKQGSPAELALLRSLMRISYHGCARARVKKGDFMRGLYFFPLTALFIIGFFLFLIFLFVFV